VAHARQRAQVSGYSFPHSVSTLTSPYHWLVVRLDACCLSDIRVQAGLWTKDLLVVRGGEQTSTVALPNLAMLPPTFAAPPPSFPLATSLPSFRLATSCSYRSSYSCHAGPAAASDVCLLLLVPAHDTAAVLRRHSWACCSAKDPPGPR
jgi:hypothetical protein